MKNNQKHIKFLEEYMINGFNATKAYLYAYPNVNENTAGVNGHKLLGTTKIKAEIERRQQELSKKKNIDREFIVNEFLEIIKSSKDQGVDGEGLLKDRTNWNKAVVNLANFLGLSAPDKKEIEHKGEISGFQIKIIPPKTDQ